MKTPDKGETRARMRDAVNDLVQKVKDDRAQTLAEKEVEQQQLRARERQKYVWLFVAVVAFAGSVAFTLPRMRAPIRPPTGAAAEHHGRQTLVYAARLVEEFQRARGRLPASMAEIGVSLPGVVLETRPGGWELSMQVDGRTVAALALRSGEDPGAFLRGR